jgi:glucose/mannose-6-phosphate isomerase
LPKKSHPSRKSKKDSSGKPRKRAPDFEAKIKQVDSSNLRDDYRDWPELAERIWKYPAQTTRAAREYSRIIFTGMGGSGITGEVLADCARELGSRISFEILKDYHLPKYAHENTLVVGMSSSGNTEETLSVLSEASSRGLDGWTFGSGGLIENLSKTKWHFNFVKTEMLKVPRSSLPGLLFYVLRELEQSGLLRIDRNDVEESIDVLASARDRCVELNRANPSLELAKELLSTKYSTALLYASNRTRAVALRARQSINENAKMHLFNGVIPELCHNDIVGWDGRRASVGKKENSAALEKPAVAVLLQLKEDDPIEIAARFEIVEKVVKSAKGATWNAPYIGKSYLARVLSMIYFLDYCSYYMAILRGIDPIKTPSIDFLKQELSARLDYVSRLK